MIMKSSLLYWNRILKSSVCDLVPCCSEITQIPDIFGFPQPACPRHPPLYPPNPWLLNPTYPLQRAKNKPIAGSGLGTAAPSQGTGSSGPCEMSQLLLPPSFTAAEGRAFTRMWRKDELQVTRTHITANQTFSPLISGKSKCSTLPVGQWTR